MFLFFVFSLSPISHIKLSTSLPALIHIQGLYFSLLIDAYKYVNSHIC